MADGIDPAVDSVKATRLDPAPDLAMGDAGREELGEGDDAMLAPCELGDHSIRLPFGAFRTHTVRKAPRASDLSPSARADCFLAAHTASSTQQSLASRGPTPRASAPSG